MKVVQLCLTLCTSMDYTVHGQHTEVGSHSLFQGIFPTQGSNSNLLQCRWILYQLSQKWSPRILEWVAYSFSSGSSWSRNWTGFPCIEGTFFTSWAIREAIICKISSKSIKSIVQFNSVAQSCLSLCDPMDCSMPGLPVHHQLLEFTQTHVHWVCDAIQPSHPLSIPFSSHLQSFQASGSFQMSQFFISGGQSIGVSASISVLPMNLQDWFPLGWTGWISLQSKGLSRIFSNTSVQKHQFSGAQLSL